METNEVTRIIRRYRSTDGIVSTALFEVRCSPAVFDLLRREFRTTQAAAHSSRRAPWAARDRDELALAMCYNGEWLDFFDFLVQEKRIEVRVVQSCTTGNRRGYPGAMDRHDGMTRADLHTEGWLELHEGAGYYHLTIEDSASSEQFQPV